MAGGGEVAERHPGQRRLADPGRAAEQDQRAGNEPAAEDAVELGDPGRAAASTARRRDVAQRAPARRARRPRRDRRLAARRRPRAAASRPACSTRRSRRSARTRRSALVPAGAGRRRGRRAGHASAIYGRPPTAQRPSHPVTDRHRPACGADSSLEMSRAVPGRGSRVVVAAAAGRACGCRAAARAAFDPALEAQELRQDRRARPVRHADAGVPGAADAAERRRRASRRRRSVADRSRAQLLRQHLRQRKQECAGDVRFYDWEDAGFGIVDAGAVHRPQRRDDLRARSGRPRRARPSARRS